MADTHRAQEIYPGRASFDFLGNRGVFRHDGFGVIVGHRVVAECEDSEVADFLCQLWNSRTDFHCWKCGAECDSAPLPPERAVCPTCCEDHEYIYEKGERRHYCTHCGQDRPDDYFY